MEPLRSEPYIENMKGISANISVSLLSYASVYAYIIATVQSINDFDNLSNKKIKLPIINSETSLISFYMWSALIVVIIHFQFLEKIVSLKNLSLKTSKALDTDYSNIIKSNEIRENISQSKIAKHFLFFEYRKTFPNRFGFIYSLIAIFGILASAPTLILYCTAMALPIHDNFVTNTQRITFVFSCVCSLFAANRLLLFESKIASWIVGILSCILSAILSIIYLCSFTFPKEYLVNKERLDTIYQYDLGIIKSIRAELYGASYMGSKIISNIIIIRLDSNLHRVANIYDFSDSNFFARNLVGMKLQKVNLTKANFTKADLTDTNFESVIFDEVNFEQSNLKNIIITKSRGIKTSFSRANMIGGLVADSRFSSGNLKDTIIYESTFRNSVFSNFDFSGSVLFDSNFNDGQLLGCDFKQSTIVKTNFRKLNLAFSSSDGLILLGSRFYDVYMLAISMRQSVLIQNMFLLSHLEFMDLSGTRNYWNTTGGSVIKKMRYSDQKYSPKNLSIVRNAMYKLYQKCIELECRTQLDEFKQIKSEIERTSREQCDSATCAQFDEIFTNGNDYSDDEYYLLLLKKFVKRHTM